MFSENDTASSSFEADIKSLPLLCMTLQDPKRKSEYAAMFSPKHRLISPGVKLSPVFLYQSSRKSDNNSLHGPQAPGFVPRTNTGALCDYNFVHTRAFYHPLQQNRQYFTLGPDWVSEKPVCKNNPFS